MQTPGTSSSIIRFGQFEIDPERNSLSRNGVRVKLQDQPFRVLLLLLENPGEIVGRETLRLNLWPNGIFVDYDGSLNVILKKIRAALGDDPDNPRFIETIPRRGYRFIAPVSRRPATEVAVAAAVAVESPSVPVRPPSEPIVTLPSTADTHKEVPPVRIASSRRRYIIAAMIAVSTGVAGWLMRGRLSTFYATSHTSITAHAAPIEIHKSVAVLGFHNVSGRPADAWLSTGLSEMLRTELSGGEKLRIVSGEDIANLRTTAPWSQTDTLNQETTSRIGNALNSEYLVLGAYTVTGHADGEQIRLDVRLQSAKQGEILAEVAEVGRSRDLFRLVSSVGARLRDRMEIPRLDDSERAGVLASSPSDADAARFYALGIEKLRQFDALSARNLLEQATRADPKFPLAHAMLARAWGALGYGQKQREEAKKAFDLSANLPRAERLLVEGDYYESLSDHDKAASVYYALFQLFPDNLDYGLQLAGAQAIAAHATQARETLAQLRRLPSPAGDDPRIDLAEAGTYQDQAAALELVRTAIKKAAAQNKKLVLASARKQECMFLNYGDHPDDAFRACDEAYTAYIAAGNEVAAADALRLLGDALGSHGSVQQSLATYQRALDMLAKLGDYEKTGAVLNNMAIHFENEGKLDRAEPLYRQAFDNFVKAGDKKNQLTALVNLADVQYARGNLANAERLYGQGLQIDSSLDLSDPSYFLYRRADLYLTQGKPQQAREEAEKAIDIIRSHKADYRNLTSAMMVLAEAEESVSDLAGARKEYQQTMGLRQKLNESDLVQETNLALAELAILEGHPEQVESILAPAIAEFEKEKSEPAEAQAYLTISRAALIQGKVAEAASALQKATQLVQSTPDPALRLPVAVQKARVFLAQAGDKASALAEVRQQLRTTIATARKLGYYRIELDARQALAEVDLRSHSAAAQTELASVIADARSHGLEMQAREAEKSALSSTPGQHPSH